MTAFSCLPLWILLSLSSFPSRLAFRPSLSSLLCALLFPSLLTTVSVSSPPFFLSSSSCFPPPVFLLLSSASPNAAHRSTLAINSRQRPPFKPFSLPPPYFLSPHVPSSKLIDKFRAVRSRQFPSAAYPAFCVVAHTSSLSSPRVFLSQLFSLVPDSIFLFSAPFSPRSIAKARPNLLSPAISIIYL